VSTPQPPCGHLFIPPGDPVADRLGLGAVALRYAALGLPVFPLRPGSKEPDTEHGFKDAATAPAQIGQWWAEEPFRGIGIVTGSVSGLAIVDLDVKNGHNGRESLTAWAAGFGLVLPWAPSQDTPSGGTHLGWRLPQGLTMTSRAGVLPGVDVRADGGYIAAWPTYLNVRVRPTAESPKGGTLVIPYGAWSRCPCQAPVMPPALFDALAALPGTSSGGGTGGGHGGGHDGQVAATVLSNVLRGMDEQECYQAWLEAAIPQNPSWPFTRADFKRRHYRTALAKAAKIRAADRQAYAAWMAATGGVS
jgi:hypothetical protein